MAPRAQARIYHITSRKTLHLRRRTLSMFQNRTSSSVPGMATIHHRVKMLMSKHNFPSVIVTRFQPQAVMPSFHLQSCSHSPSQNNRPPNHNAVLFLSFKINETRHTNGLSPIEVKRVARQITELDLVLSESQSAIHSAIVKAALLLDRNGWYVLFWLQAIIVLQFVVKSTARSSITSKHRGSNSMRTGSSFVSPLQHERPHCVTRWSSQAP